jgi:hypothetical protein
MLVLTLSLICLQASKGNADLDAASRAYADGDYQRVLPLVHSAWRAALSDADIRRALELEALARAAFDQAEPAIEAFQYLLAVAPQFLPDSQASPKVLAFFAEARRRGPLGTLSRPEPQRPAWTQPAIEPSRALEAAGTPIYRRWWFWAGAAVVAAGGGFGAWEALHPVVPTGSLPGRSMR